MGETLLSTWGVRSARADEPASRPVTVPTVPSSSEEVTGASTEGCPTGVTCTPLRLRVRRAGDRVPLAAASVVITDAGDGSDRASPGAVPGVAPSWTRRAETDAQGEVTIEGVPLGRVRILVLVPGFEPVDAVRDLARKPGAGPKSRPLAFFLRVDRATAYRTVVRARPEGPASYHVARTLSREELDTLPGSQGDALRGLQNLPGAARTPGGLGFLVLRGADPTRSQVFVGQHPVPRAFHILGLASVLPTQTIERSVLVPGNFSARYGQATGGVVLITPKVPRRDGYHGHAKVDLTGVGALVEGPLRRGSFLAGVARGYVDAVLGVVRRYDESVRSLVLPAYTDYQLWFRGPRRQKGGLDVRWLGGYDRARQLGTKWDGSSYPVVDFKTGFHRFDVEWNRTHGATTFMLAPVVRFDHFARSELDGARRELRYDVVPRLRAELGHDLTKRARVLAGTDLGVDVFWFEREVKKREDENAKTHGTSFDVATYLLATFTAGPLTFDGGARASTFGFQGTYRSRVDPRARVDLRVTDRLSFYVAAGLYSQAAIAGPREVLGLGKTPPVTGSSEGGELHVYLSPALERVFALNLSTSPEKNALVVRTASQVSGGARWFVGRRDHPLELVGFHRKEDGGEPASFLGTKSEASGLEFIARLGEHRTLSGFVAYSLLWVHTTVRGLDGTRTRFHDDFDQRHRVTALASLALPHGFRLGARFSLASGFPYTSIVAVQESTEFPVSDTRRYNPVFEPTNASRFKTFHQLDLRLDKRWTLKRAAVLAYLDILNVYNARNVEGVLYTFDYREKSAAFGLPIFPVAGGRAEY